MSHPRATNTLTRPMYDVRAVNHDCSIMHPDKNLAFRGPRAANRYANKLRREGYPVRIFTLTPEQGVARKRIPFLARATNRL